MKVVNLPGRESGGRFEICKSVLRFRLAKLLNRCAPWGRAILMSETLVPSGNSLEEWLKARRVEKFDAAVVRGRW